MLQYLELAVWADLNLGRGESKRILCPWCDGGSTHEKSLKIVCNEDGSLWWRCFRAKCGEMGSRNANGLRSIKAKKAAPRYYEGALVNLRESDLEFFNRVFGLDPPDLKTVSYAPEEDRYCFRALSPSSTERGFILRSFSGASPKALTFRTRVEEPFIGWYKDSGAPRGPLVIVEDTVSAIKVYKAGGSAVALFGTYLNYQMVTEIGGEWYEGDVVLALDKGTMPLMLKYKSKYDTLIGPIKIWKLEEDLKYERVESIKQGLFNGKADFGKASTSSVSQGA